MSGCGSNRTLAACVAVSIALHAAATGIVAVQGDGQDRRASGEAFQPPTRKSPDLGDPAASRASIDWIGFESPRPHIAPESEVNQPALARQAASQPPVDEPRPPASPPSSPSSPPAASEAARPAPSVRIDPAELGDMPLSLRADRASREPTPIISVPPQVQTASPADPTLATPSKATPSKASPAPAQPAPHQPAPAATTATDPGAPSERESAAASRKPPVEARLSPGEVLSASGLKITTRRPQFETLTRLVARPDNPVVQIYFKRDGRVSRVDLLESSHVPAVDSPVVNAVYNWTAEGEPLRRLPADDPNATVDVTIRILLR